MSIPDNSAAAQAIRDAIEKLREIALTSGDDFRVRVMRSASDASNREPYVTLDGARLEHFVAPENWLTKLTGAGGGGVFELLIYHASDTTRLLPNTFRVKKPGNPSPPDLAALRSPDWKGPVGPLIYPDTDANRDQSPFLSLAADAGPTSAARDMPRGSAGTAFGVPGLSVSAGSPGFSYDHERANADERERLARRERELEDAKRKAEGELEARRRKLELEELDAKHRRDMAEFETRLQRSAQPAEPAPKATEIVTAIGAALSPLFTLIQQGNDRRAELETRRLEAEAQQRRDEAKARESREERERSEDRLREERRLERDKAERLERDKLELDQRKFTAELQKEARARDDRMFDLLASGKNQTTEQSEAMAHMANTVLQVATTAAELTMQGAPPRERPPDRMTAIVNQLGKGVESLGAGWKASAAAERRKADAAIAIAQAGDTRGARQVLNGNRPNPVAAPGGGKPQPRRRALPPGQQPVPPPPSYDEERDPVDEMVRFIVGKTDPKFVVAKFFWFLKHDPRFKLALQKHNGQPLEMFGAEARIQEFATDPVHGEAHGAYLAQCFETLKLEMMKRGMIADPTVIPAVPLEPAAAQPATAQPPHSQPELEPEDPELDPNQDDLEGYPEEDDGGEEGEIGEPEVPEENS